MIENSICESTRGQLITFNDFSGSLLISNLTIANHTGAPNNIYLTTSTNSNLNLPLTTVLSPRNLGSKTPLFRFSPTVTLITVNFLSWSVSGVNFAEDSGCSVTNPAYMLFGFPGSTLLGAIANTFTVNHTTSIQLLQNINCY